jgi:hypothetical protein
MLLINFCPKPRGPVGYLVTVTLTIIFTPGSHSIWYEAPGLPRLQPSLTCTSIPPSPIGIVSRATGVIYIEVHTEGLKLEDVSFCFNYGCLSIVFVGVYNCTIC